jgi:hypothetical protein
MDNEDINNRKTEQLIDDREKQLNRMLRLLITAVIYHIQWSRQT